MARTHAVPKDYIRNLKRGSQKVVQLVRWSDCQGGHIPSVAVSHGYGTCFRERLVMGYGLRQRKRDFDVNQDANVQNVQLKFLFWPQC